MEYADVKEKVKLLAENPLSDSAKRTIRSTSPSTAFTAPAPSPPTKTAWSICLSCMRR